MQAYRIKGKQALVSRLLVLGLLLPLLAAACSPRTRYQILSFMLDGVPPYEEWLNPPPPEPGRRVEWRIRYRQRAAHPTIAAQPKLSTPFSEGRPEIEQLHSWEEVANALPKNAVGGEDWQAALEQGIIAPLTSLEPGKTTLEPFPLDVELTPDDNPMFAVTFRHQSHTSWLACDNCHPAIFQMAAGADDISMETIYAGEHCGRCHGKVAFDVATSCSICHQAMAE